MSRVSKDTIVWSFLIILFLFVFSGGSGGATCGSCGSCGSCATCGTTYACHLSSWPDRTAMWVCQSDPLFYNGRWFSFCLERFRHPQLFTLYVRWPLSGTHSIFLWSSGRTMLAVGFSASIAAFGPIRRDPAPPTSTIDSNSPLRMFCGYALRPLNSPMIICSSPNIEPMSLFALSMIAPIPKPLFSPFRTVTIRRWN